MTMIPFEERDYLSEARSRYTEQFKDKVVFDKYIALILESCVELQEEVKKVLQNTTLNTATGYTLDLIGALVGQKRGIAQSTAIEYFGFTGAGGEKALGDINDSSLGGLFYGYGDPDSGNVYLNDEYYRILIRARILANTSKVTPEDVIASLKFLIGSDYGSITEQPNAHLTLNFGKILSPFEKYLVQGLGESKGLIPVPVGVAVDYVQYDGDQFFAFLGVTNAKGFGDLYESTGYGFIYGENYGGDTIEGEVINGGYFASIF